MPTPATEPPRCKLCGRLKPDVKWDDAMKAACCDECWFHTRPPDSTPPPRDRCKGK